MSFPIGLLVEGDLLFVHLDYVCPGDHFEFPFVLRLSIFLVQFADPVG